MEVLTEDQDTITSVKVSIILNNPRYSINCQRMAFWRHTDLPPLPAPQAEKVEDEPMNDARFVKLLGKR